MSIISDYSSYRNRRKGRTSRTLKEHLLAGPVKPASQRLEERNMDYCKFQNTYYDLIQCWEGWDDEEEKDMSSQEAMYRRKLLELCEDIVDTYSEDY